MPKLIPVFLLAAISAAAAQTPPASTLAPLDAIPFDNAGPVLRERTTPTQPFTVAGPHGALIGAQDGSFESWILPVKLISHFTIEANVESYGVPIDVNQQTAQIEVRPDRTTITYTHPTFTVRQIMFSPANGPSALSTPGAPSLPSASAEERVGPQTGPIVLFEFDCLHPTDFTFRFIPELKWMWPERNEGIPGPEWVSANPHDPSSSGWFVLHTDYPNLAGAITIPGTTRGILAPYQERPQVRPLELHLHIDPARDHGKLFPLLMAAGISPSTATNAALADTLAQLNTNIAALYAANAEAWKNLLAHSTSITTPDPVLNEAFQWAVVSIEQLKIPTIPGQSSPPTGGGTRAYASEELASAAPQVPETALIAGYYTSADTARPGFGWFFGRDALYTLYAVNGYGDFALSRSELEFLIHRQRADGKIMHEYSQTAAAIDWRAFPYMYAAADSTPLFLLATADYVRSSGDTAFLTTYRDAIEKAWAFETDPAHDTDHDGIYDNSQGTGWVESWPGGMPHQEIYLALLDQQASSAMAWIERELNDSAKSSDAIKRAELIAKTINAEYYDSQKSCYAFSHNLDGSQDRTTTVYPAMAWWDPTYNTIAPKPAAAKTIPERSILDHPDPCLRNFVASALNTDWGLRDVAHTEPIYDGLSYHQGSVWPLFTGWAALAEYRGNQPLAGYQLLMENAQLTRASDLGAVTELLSGDFYVPFGRSTSHQLWSSAMVITPTLRGLFGISIDAQSKTITVNPHIPASWDHAEVRDLHIGSDTVDLVFTQTHDALSVSIRSSTGVTLRSDPSLVHSISNGNLVLARAPVEIGPIFNASLPGSRTQSFRVLDQQWSDHKLALTLEGPANSDAQLPLVLNAMNLNLHAEGARLPTASDAVPHTPGSLPALHVHFPPGTGYQTQTVTLTW
jgi:glycogen debranching enzyme